MKTIIFTRVAEKQLDALPPPIQAQIGDALDRYATSGEGDVKKLANRPGHRLRVGRYRVIFHEDLQTVLAVQVGKRDSTTYSGGRI
jgi:mRNA interferase RelE/StbE